MARLRNDEVRRLLSYLTAQIQDTARLAEIQDELRGGYGEEFLREPGLLVYFPEETDEILAAGAKWTLRIIPHAHLRIVQRGIKLSAVRKIFQRFLETCAAQQIMVTTGPYTIFASLAQRHIAVRADVDLIDDRGGRAHVVTVIIGSVDNEEMMNIGRV